VKTQSVLAAVGGALALLTSAGGFADEAPAKPEAARAAEEVVTLGKLETALSTDELGEQRAKAKIELEEVTINTPENNGAVVGNVALGDTGYNKIDGNAFRNSAGFMNAIQNTGNNVLIQNATIINVSVEP
jgi:hypothetical protein